jgi:hypothetical protein
LYGAKEFGCSAELRFPSSSRISGRRCTPRGPAGIATAWYHKYLDPGKAKIMLEARFRHRAKDSEVILELHAKVVSCLESIHWLWDRIPIKTVLSSHGESAACDLTGYLKDGVRGAISYSARFAGKMQDKAMYDDVLTLQVDEGIVPYRDFVFKAFEQIVSCFNPYRASIVHDLDLDLEDYEQIINLAQTSGKDIDGRDSVYRINPVNFFDNELCKRSFGLSANDVFNRLKGHVEYVAVQNGGALVIVTGDVVDRKELPSVHAHIEELIGISTAS